MNVAVHDLSVRQLQYIVAVADTLGFHRAAERCHVSQPTLSSQVQKLEEILGVTIFERNRRRVLITDAGALVVERARRVLVELDDLVVAANQGKDPFARTLRVGVLPTIAPYLLPWLMPSIAKRWPRLRLALSELKTDELVSALRGGTLDAGILALVDGMHDLEHVVLASDPFVVAFSPSHRLARKKKIALDALAQENVFLLDDGHCLRTQALALCRRAGATEADYRATSLATLVQMVSSGSGVTLLPSIAIEVENRRGQLAVRALEGRAALRTLCLAFRRSTPLAGALRTIATVMAAAAKPATKSPAASP